MTKDTKQCAVCTYLNKDNAVACEMCESPFPSTEEDKTDRILENLAVSEKPLSAATEDIASESTSSPNLSSSALPKAPSPTVRFADPPVTNSFPKITKADEEKQEKEEKEEECWVCNACTLENPPQAKVCEVCQTPKGDIMTERSVPETTSSSPPRVASPMAPASASTSTPAPAPFSTGSASPTTAPHCYPSALPDYPVSSSTAQANAKVAAGGGVTETFQQVTGNLREKTNTLVRGMGCNLKVRCPSCNFVAPVPPAVTCLKCECCGYFFSSPTVGDATNFHVSRVAKKMTDSIRSFLFTADGTTSLVDGNDEESRVAREIPLGIPVDPIVGAATINAETAANAENEANRAAANPINSNTSANGLDESAVLVNGSVSSI